MNLLNQQLHSGHTHFTHWVVLLVTHVLSSIVVQIDEKKKAPSSSDKKDDVASLFVTTVTDSSRSYQKKSSGHGRSKGSNGTKSDSNSDELIDSAVDILSGLGIRLPWQLVSEVSERLIKLLVSHCKESEWEAIPVICKVCSTHTHTHIHTHTPCL